MRKTNGNYSNQNNTINTILKYNIMNLLKKIVIIVFIIQIFCSLTSYAEELSFDIIDLTSIDIEPTTCFAGLGFQQWMTNIIRIGEIFLFGIIMIVIIIFSCFIFISQKRLNSMSGEQLTDEIKKRKQKRIVTSKKILKILIIISIIFLIIIEFLIRDIRFLQFIYDNTMI